MSESFHNRSGRRHRAQTGGETGKGLSVLAGVLGLASLVAAVVTVVHAIAPHKWTLPSTSVMMVVAVLAALTAIVLTVIARRRARRSGARKRPGTMAILTVVLAVLCMVLGLLIARMIPDGIVKPAVRDAAPVSSAQQMKTGVEQVGGVCAGGWHDVDASSYPGVNEISLCEDNRMAFVTFDTAASASMDRGFVKSAIAQQLQSHASDSRAKGDWRILNGGRWMVVGTRDPILKLQKLWGGSVESVS